MFSWLFKKKAKKSIFELIEECNIEGIQEAINNGANLNIQNSNGETPLMRCVLYLSNLSYLEIIITLLLENGADPNKKDNKGRNASLYIVQHPLKNLNISNNPYPRICDLITGYAYREKSLASYPTQPDMWGIALIHQIQELDIINHPYGIIKIKDLINHGANINIHTGGGDTKEMIIRDDGDKFSIFFVKGSEIETHMTNALISSIEKNLDEITELLITKGANVNATVIRYNSFGLTPLMSAILKNNEKITELLIENGAEILPQTKNGEAILKLANISGNEKISQIVNEAYHKKNGSSFEKEIYIEHYGKTKISNTYFKGGNVEDTSNRINEIYYSKKDKYMIILLNNKYYHYINVEEELRKEFLSKKNKYKFYEKEIFGNFDARKGFIPHY